MTDRTVLPLHAEFLLLAHDPASGRKLVEAAHVKAGLAGAALLELNLQEALTLQGEGRQARLRSTGADVDPELVEVLSRADGHAPKKAVARIGGAGCFTDRAGRLRDATWNRLESDGQVRSEEDRVLGLFPTTRRVQLSSARSASLATMQTALDSTEQPSLRTAAIIAVAHASGLLRKLFPERDKKQLSERAKQIGEGGWGGAAVAEAIADVQAAIVTAVIVPVVVSASD